ncbi:hypothetical protein BS78_01G134000 [Paspalum vaginatum]|nr:hypothetical protein BS78_01G134000 [Paspalum vaginatum]
MANRKRKWGVAFTARGRGPCRLLGWLRHVRPRKVYQLPSPSDSSFSSSEVTGTSSSSSSLEVTGTRPSYPRPLIWGTRSIKQSEPWTCEVCGFKNELIHHLMFDLPPFNCKACDADPPEGSTDFGFCYGDLALNEFCPISNVKNQKGPTCIANALSSAVEITHRVMKII